MIEGLEMRPVEKQPRLSLLDKILVMAQRRHITHYMCVSTTRTTGNLCCVPWVCSNTKNLFYRVARHNVLVMSTTMWNILSHPIPECINVVISHDDVGINKSSESPDYIIKPNELYKLYAMHVELVGKEIVIVGDTKVLEHTRLQAKNVYVTEVPWERTDGIQVTYDIKLSRQLADKSFVLTQGTIHKAQSLSYTLILHQTGWKNRVLNKYIKHRVRRKQSMEKLTKILKT